MIKIAICDDEAIERDEEVAKVRGFLDKQQVKAMIDSYESGEDMLEQFDGQYDLIILDIEMKSMDGITLGRHIREQDPKVVLVFMTSHEEYALDSFQLDTCGYILKGSDEHNFENQIRRAIKRVEESKDDFVFVNQLKTVCIAASSILYAEHFKHQLSIYTIDGEVVELRGQMKDVFEQDKQHRMITLYRGLAVNKTWIKTCEKMRVTMRYTEKEFRVSRSQWKTVRSEYNQYCMERIARMEE